MNSFSKLLGIAALGASLSFGATAGTITAYYGDDDGFGIGATTGTINATVSNAAVGEAAGTDTQLIGSASFFAGPNFGPSGGFAFAVPSGSIIVGATLTMRVGSWTNNGNPVDGPGSNLIKLDGQDVDAAFLASFTANLGGGDDIEERTINLTPDFFADMADGSVSLAGSNLSEAGGFGSFQVDFLRLDITTRETSDVPAPAPLGLLALGLGVLGVAKRRRA